MRVLIIDDSRATRAILKRMLAQLGFQAAEAENGADGLSMLAAIGNVDLVLVDWNMPTMNGFDFLQAARADAKYAEVPIVMVTTETEISQMTRALEHGATEYIMKPFTLDVLRDKLALLGLVSTT